LVLRKGRRLKRERTVEENWWVKISMYWGARGEVGTKIKVGEIDGAKESVVGDDRVEKDVDGRERGKLGRGGAGRSAANTTVYARRVAALGAGEEERSGGPLLLRNGVVTRGGGGGVVDGTEGPGSFDELNELVVATLQPLQTVGASKSGAEGEGRARGVKVEGRGRSIRRDRDGGGGGEKVCEGGGDQRRQGRAKIGGRDTRCSGGETERGERKTKEGRRGGDASGWVIGGQCGVNVYPCPLMGRREWRWWERGGRDSTVSPPVGNGVGRICARGIQ
jgi:hypothetical protein